MAKSFGIGYEEALQHLTGLHTLEDSEKLDKEMELLAKFAKSVPTSISTVGFRDLIAKMTPNILLNQNKWGTILHKMARHGKSSALVALLAVGEEDYREVIDQVGHTPLFVAALNGHLDCVRVLLRDSRPEYRKIASKFGFTALHIACEENHSECVKALLEDSCPEYREMVDEDQLTPLLIATKMNCVRCVKALLKDSRPEYREIIDENGSTALHFASEFGHVTCVEALLEDARPKFREMTNSEGLKAINLVHCKSKIFRLLVEAKVNDMVVSITSRTLFVLDDKYRFNFDDSNVKDTLLWIIGDDHFGLYC